MSSGSCFADAVDLVSHKNAFECALTIKEMRDKVELHTTILPFLCEMANISSEQPQLTIAFEYFALVSSAW